MVTYILILVLSAFYQAHSQPCPGNPPSVIPVDTIYVTANKAFILSDDVSTEDCLPKPLNFGCSNAIPEPKVCFSSSADLCPSGRRLDLPNSVPRPFNFGCQESCLSRPLNFGCLSEPKACFPSPDLCPLGCPRFELPNLAPRQCYESTIPPLPRCNVEPPNTINFVSGSLTPCCSDTFPNTLSPDSICRSSKICCSKPAINTCQTPLQIGCSQSNTLEYCSSTNAPTCFQTPINVCSEPSGVVTSRTFTPLSCELPWKNNPCIPSSCSNPIVPPSLKTCPKPQDSLCCSKIPINCPCNTPSLCNPFVEIPSASSTCLDLCDSFPEPCIPSPLSSFCGIPSSCPIVPPNCVTSPIIYERTNQDNSLAMNLANILRLVVMNSLVPKLNPVPCNTPLDILNPVTCPTSINCGSSNGLNLNALGGQAYWVNNFPSELNPVIPNLCEFSGVNPVPPPVLCPTSLPPNCLPPTPISCPSNLCSLENSVPPNLCNFPPFNPVLDNPEICCQITPEGYFYLNSNPLNVCETSEIPLSPYVTAQIPSLPVNICEVSNIVTQECPTEVSVSPLEIIGLAETPITYEVVTDIAPQISSYISTPMTSCITETLFPYGYEIVDVNPMIAEFVNPIVTNPFSVLSQPTYGALPGASYLSSYISSSPSSSYGTYPESNQCSGQPLYFELLLPSSIPAQLVCEMPTTLPGVSLCIEPLLDQCQ